MAMNKPKKVVKKAKNASPAEISGERWVDRMKRWTLMFPKDLIEDVKKEARRSGRTHSRVVVDAVRNAVRRSPS